MRHLSEEAIARYLISTGSRDERRRVEWHLENCPDCRGQLRVRDLLTIARSARDRIVAAVRSAERN